MTQTLPLTQVAALPWNDAYCECAYDGCIPRGAVDFVHGEPCDRHLVQTFLEKVEECKDPFIESIMRDGMLTPIELNKEGTRIMNGHHRLALAILLMLDEVPVHYGWLDGEDEFLPQSYTE